MSSGSETIGRERQSHNDLYAEQGKRIIEPLEWDHYRDVHRPPHEGGWLYGLDVRLFMDLADAELARLGPGARILDYACGAGEFSIILARRGYRVTGFDLSDEGVRIARSLAEKYEVTDRTEFHQANAQDLAFDDDSFDLAVGKAVLHHICKYPGTGNELHRVLKPGGRAVFCEGVASNPLVRIARWFTARDAPGDVPLTARGIRRWGHLFSRTDITGYFFLYMLKRLGYRYTETLETELNGFGKTRVFRGLLRVALSLDDAFVNRRAITRWLAGRYMIEFTK